MKIIILLLFSVTCFAQVKWTPNNPVTGGYVYITGDCGDGVTAAESLLPTNVLATGYHSPARVVLSWTQSGGDSAYQTYIMAEVNSVDFGDGATHSCFDSTNVIGSTSHTIYNVEEGDFISIKFRVKDPDGKVTRWSYFVDFGSTTDGYDSAYVPIAPTSDTTPPNPIVSLTGEVFNVIAIPATYAEFNWSVSGMSSDAAYILVDTSVVGDTTTFGNVDSLAINIITWQDTSVEASDLRKWLFSVVDDSGNVSDTLTYKGTIPAEPSVPNPNAPDLAAVADTFKVTLTVDTTGCWTNGGGTIDSMKFYESGSLLVTQIGLEYIHTGLTTNTAYSYTAKVKDSNLNLSAASTTENVTTIDSTTFAYTKHYVLSDTTTATGGRANNGTSWFDGWWGFGAINWGVVDPGDIVYIDGGTDSVIYNEEMTISTLQGTFEHRITIRNSWETGHNGEVIIDGGNKTRTGIYVGSQGAVAGYITIYGLTIRDCFTGIDLHWNVDYVTIDSCYIYDWQDNGIYMGGNTADPDNGIKNTIIQNNDLVGNVTTCEDNIQGNSTMNTIVRNNFIWVRNRADYNAHVDGILMMWSRGIVFYNNIVIEDSNASGQAYICAMSDKIGDGITDSVIVYNNFFYNGGVYSSSIYPSSVSQVIFYNAVGREPGTQFPPSYGVHNTIITWGEGNYCTFFMVSAQVTFVNNITAQYWHQYWAGHTRLAIRASGSPLVDSIRNNLVWQQWEAEDDDGLFAGDFTGNGQTIHTPTWAEWTNDLLGTGVNANPLLVNTIGGYAEGGYTLDDQWQINGVLQAGSPAIGQGEDTQSLISNYALWDGTYLPWVYCGTKAWNVRGVPNGAARPTSATPTIGAFDNE